MNPVIFVGLAALIIAGVYAMHLGMAQQAELAELHRGILDASAARAEAAGQLRGEIRDEMHLIIMNPTAHAAHLIQVRAYDDDGKSGTESWPLWHAIPPHVTYNLTAYAALPPALEHVLQNRTHMLRGVTAQGVIFPITYAGAPAAAAPGGALASMTAMGLNTSAKMQEDSYHRTEFHYSEDGGRCKQFFSKPGQSYYVIWKKDIIYDRPFHVSSKGIGDATPGPAGDPAWFHWYKTGQKTSSHNPAPDCTATPGFSAVYNHPSGLDLVAGLAERVYYRAFIPATYEIDMRAPIAGEGNHSTIVAQHDGTMMIRVEMPASAHVLASYSFGKSGWECERYTRNHRCDCMTESSDVIDDRIAWWENQIADPSFLAAIAVKRNGMPAGAIMMPMVGGGSGAEPVRTIDRDMNLASTGHDPHDVLQCRFGLSGDVHGAWAYADALDGWIRIEVARGDVITLDGHATLEYVPASIPDGSVWRTHGAFELGDAIMTVGAGR